MAALNLQDFSRGTGVDVKSARITRRKGIMMNRIFQNHWCRLIAGNLSIALLVIGVPVAVMFAITGTLAITSAVLLILACVHLSLVGLQISRQGTWIPEKWLAAGFVFLPVIDVSQTVAMFSKDLWLEGVWAFLLAVAAAFITVSIVKNQWQKWQAPKTTTVTIKRSSNGNQAAIHPADDPTTMVY
jgi:hypothetical protein